MAESSDFKLISVHAAEPSADSECAGSNEVVAAETEPQVPCASAVAQPERQGESEGQEERRGEPQGQEDSETMQHFAPPHEDPEERAARLRRERLARQAEELQRQEENLNGGKVPMSGARIALVVAGVLVLVLFVVLYMGVIPL